MTPNMPTEIGFGKVVGQFLWAIPDTADADRYPDAQTPPTGNIKFTAATPIRRTTNFPATVYKQSATCTLDAEGMLTDPQGNPGIWLVEGNWNVTYTVEGFTGLTQTITVTTAHTDASPLDLSLAAAPTGPEPSATQWEQLNSRLAALESSAVLSDGSLKYAVRMTQAAYDALLVKDPTTMYVITG